MNPNQKPMTPEEFEAKMREIFSSEGYDNEEAHGKADTLMVQLLTSLGYGGGCKIFEDADKWYA